jgi:hypothetical protein
MRPLRVLVVATKAPWPPVDGGRVVLFNTIEALAAQGHRVDLVAPCADGRDEIAAALESICTPHLVAAGPRSAFASLVGAMSGGVPVTIARHTIPAVRQVVGALVRSGEIDVVHAEQLHALAQTGPANDRDVPVVHRAHNVEGRLWAYAAGHRSAVVRPLVAFEARRMSDYEISALATATCTVALAEPDRRAFAEMVPGATIHTIRAPFAAELPVGPGGLEGSPAVVTLGSATWAPSRDAVNRLAGSIWPTVRRRLPEAVLHVFGGDRRLDGRDGVVRHPSPSDSRTAFPEGAVVVIPERHPTGVPMKALEAWARGLPLLVDGPTAEILDAGDGDELLVARDADGYARALARLVEEPELHRSLVRGGRRKLAEDHNPASVAEHLTRLYRWAVER